MFKNSDNVPGSSKNIKFVPIKIFNPVYMFGFIQWFSSHCNQLYELLLCTLAAISLLLLHISQKCITMTVCVGKIWKTIKFTSDSVWHLFDKQILFSMYCIIFYVAILFWEVNVISSWSLIANTIIRLKKWKKNQMQN